MPSLNMEFGQQVNTKIGWFTKFTMGAKLRHNVGFTPVLFHQFGVKMNLGLF